MHLTAASPALHAALLLGAMASLPAQDWAQFRGVAGQGVASGAALPRTFTDANVRWRVQLPGAGHSSPVVFGDRVFVTLMGTAKGTRELRCFDAGSGAEVWTYTDSFTGHRLHKFNSFASSTPAVDAAGIYILWTSGPDLVALAVDHEGQKRWQVRLGKHRAQHGSGASPILFGGKLIVANDNEGEESFLAALDPKDGEVAWRVDRKSSEKAGAYNCPVPYTPPEGDAYLLFVSQTHGLTGVAPADGKVLFEWDPEFKMRCVGTPCISGDQLFFATGSGGSGKECAFVRLPARAGDQPKRTHSMRRSIPYVPCALALDGRFYMFNDGGVATCIAASSGDVVWRERLDGTFFASPVSDGRTIYIPAQDGTLFSLAAGEKHAVLGTFELGATAYATPAIAQGRLYARTTEALLCLGAPAGDRKTP